MEWTQYSRVNPLTLKCDLDLEPGNRLTERNIWVKFDENCSKGSGDMERTQIEG